MIIYLASYPKSGNTWLRSLLSSYYFSNDGNFKIDLLKNIQQFPQKKYLDKYKYELNVPGSTAQYWIKSQKEINIDNKIRFFKTHNSLTSINNVDKLIAIQNEIQEKSIQLNNFTDNKNTLGCIYIVRDPRNVITSLKNHFDLNYEESLEFMLNKNKYTYDQKKKNDFSDFQFLSSWEINYQSWKMSKLFPIKFIKYEDLLNKTFDVFKNLINYVDKISNNKNKFNKQKAQNSIKTTTFSKLKEYEKNNQFPESVLSKRDFKKIPFFHLGPENNWKKILSGDFQKKLNTIFKKNLQELEYD